MTNDHSVAKHVLVVEDEPDFAALLRSILTNAGYTVATTYYSDQALSLVADLKPDLITLDIQMPGQSGLFFYRKLKTDEAFRDIPVVIVSGLLRGDRDMENLVHTFLEAENVPPPEAYLEKPVDGPTLLGTIQEVLSSRKCESC